MIEGVMETYEELRERHEKELKEWVLRVAEGGGSINGMARRAGINAGTFHRLYMRYVGRAGDGV